MIVIWFILFCIFIYFGRDFVFTSVKNESTNASQQSTVVNTDRPKKKANELRSLMNKHDRSISDILTKASKLFEQGKIEESVRELTFISSKYPKSPLAKYKKAQALDKKAHGMRSNELLLEAAKEFHGVADIDDCPPELIKLTLRKQAEILAFLGKYMNAVKTLERLVHLFPSDHELYRSIGVNYLMGGKTKQALAPFQKVWI